jgi:hypothetical protein
VTERRDPGPAQPGRDAFVLLDGANELTGARALWWVLRHWPALRREMRATEGYLAHRIWYSPPYTIGLLTWWTDEKAAYRFAHAPQHTKFWRWGSEPGHTSGGWLATYRYLHGGPLWGNGVQSLARTFAGRVPAPGGKPADPPRER